MPWLESKKQTGLISSRYASVELMQQSVAYGRSPRSCPPQTAETIGAGLPKRIAEQDRRPAG
jgi:hypothetical protein